MSQAPPNLGSTYLRLRPDCPVEQLAVDGHFWPRLMGGQLGDFHNEYLVTSFRYDGDWPNWEMHPAGPGAVMRPGSLARLAATCLMALPQALTAADASAPPLTPAARLMQLESREQIRELLVAYGATLDARDFEGFGQLFAPDAEYVSGGSTTRGRAAIRAQLEQVLKANPSNLPAPNFHVGFNASISVDGDTATARSLGAYTAPDAAGGGTRLVFFVVYEDELVRVDGRWLFQRRVVGSRL